MAWSPSLHPSVENLLSPVSSATSGYPRHVNAERATLPLLNHSVRGVGQKLPVSGDDTWSPVSRDVVAGSRLVCTEVNAVDVTRPVTSARLRHEAIARHEVTDAVREGSLARPSVWPHPFLALPLVVCPWYKTLAMGRWSLLTQEERIMQTNTMKRALERGETQVGVWINMVRNPAILRLMKSAGLDFARFDMEHASPSMETLSNMALLARAMDFTLTVRPPQGNREWITRILDAGVWSLHVPQVDTPEIAHEVVNASLYAPDGLRGMAGIGNHTDYETGPVGETQRFLNAQIHLAIMFESQQAFDNIDAILSVPGIHAVTLGPADLAQELGVFGTPDQGKVIDEYRLRLIEAAGRHGKDVSMLVGSIEQGEQWIRAGAKIICYSSEVEILRRGIMEAATRLHAVRS
jgi:2-keto-3-deoxy-L-rhamnonate aldolase RhmA